MSSNTKGSVSNNVSINTKPVKREKRIESTSCSDLNTSESCTFSTIQPSQETWRSDAKNERPENSERIDTSLLPSQPLHYSEHKSFGTDSENRLVKPTKTIIAGYGTHNASVYSDKVQRKKSILSLNKSREADATLMIKRGSKKRVSPTDSSSNLRRRLYANDQSASVKPSSAHRSPLLKPSILEKAPAPAGLLHLALQDNGINVGSITAPPSSTRGVCLTNPNKPTSNNGMDNVEGNLILHKGDIVKMPNKQIHLMNYDHKFASTNKFASTEFMIIEMLGQGTFAQVFKCKNLATGQQVALKINKSTYTRQATIEIDVFQALITDKPDGPYTGEDVDQRNKLQKDNDKMKNMVKLMCYFMYQSHLCLVFELLGLNLYEVLKQRQFRGLPIAIVKKFMKQAINGIQEVSDRGIVHCDLKPENILVVNDIKLETVINKQEHDNGTISSTQSSRKNEEEENTNSNSKKMLDQRIKLIDFGSACFEGQVSHTYIQSRFYRSPEVLVGLDYDSAIDMWSLGCVAAELFLGLPILPGVHEHDQLARISEMIGDIPEWMLEQG